MFSQWTNGRKPEEWAFEILWHINPLFRAQPVFLQRDSTLWRQETQSLELALILRENQTALLQHLKTLKGKTIMKPPKPTLKPQKTTTTTFSFSGSKFSRVYCFKAGLQWRSEGGIQARVLNPRGFLFSMLRVDIKSFYHCHRNKFLQELPTGSLSHQIGETGGTPTFMIQCSSTLMTTWVTTSDTWGSQKGKWNFPLKLFLHKELKHID